MLLYMDGLTYVFTLTRREDILDFVVNFDDSIMGATRGLFGNFNGDNIDDFIMNNGVQIPSDASDQMLHDFGQSCECWCVLSCQHTPFQPQSTPVKLLLTTQYVVSLRPVVQ